MPNGYDYTKEYGPHDFGGEATSHRQDCRHDCGAWMSGGMSNTPLGIDLSGECPGNPVDGKPIGGNADYEVVVERRITKLEKENYKIKTENERLRLTADFDKEVLFNKLEAAEKKLLGIEELTKNLNAFLNSPNTLG